MAMLSLIVIFGFVMVGVPAQPGHGTKMCYGCHSTADNNNCHAHTRCHGEASCGTEVRTEHHSSHTHFFIGCIERHECDHGPSLVGKRQHGHSVKCRECCNGNLCNHGQCDSFAHHVTAKPTTTPVPTTVAPDSLCVDYESESFKCSTLGHTNFCHDDTHSSHYLAHTNCKKYCGYCSPTGSTTVRKCVDDPTFNCADYDILNFCTDTTSIAYSLAAEKCPAHCKYCTPDAVATTNVPSVTTALPASPDVVVTTNVPFVTTGFPASPDTGVNTDLPTATSSLPFKPSAAVVNVTTATIMQPSHAPTHGHVRPCADDESNGFLCADYDAKNFCNDTTIPEHLFALEKCPAHCHFCTPPV